MAWSRSPATEELVADIKLGAFERPAGRLGAQSESGSRTIRAMRRTLKPLHRSGSRITPGRPPRYASCCARSRCTASTAIMPIWWQGFSLHLAACLVRFSRMERHRSSGCRGRTSAAGGGPQYCIETTAYQAGAEIKQW